MYTNDNISRPGLYALLLVDLVYSTGRPGLYALLLVDLVYSTGRPGLYALLLVDLVYSTGTENGIIPMLLGFGVLEDKMPSCFGLWL